MNPGQLTRFRGRVQTELESLFPTTVRVGASADLAAARWTRSTGGTTELAGILPSCDVAFRIRRTLLAGITITPERTLVVEGAKTYRVLKVRDAIGDPALMLECKEA